MKVISSKFFGVFIKNKVGCLVEQKDDGYFNGDGASCFIDSLFSRQSISKEVLTGYEYASFALGGSLRYLSENQKNDLQNITTAEQGLFILDKIEVLAYEDIENAKEAMKYVELDSRLGWEPSMEYVGDVWHLDWKIRQVNSALREIADYRKILSLTGEEN